VLVLSNSRYNALTKLAIICPITKQIKNYPTEVPLPESLKTKGVVLAGQIRTLDWHTRGFDAVETASDELLKRVLDIVVTVIEG
jgi:mRNA interferase MazF